MTRQPYNAGITRYLRIAFSAMCGIACVLLIVLWVRSYHFIDIWDYDKTVLIHSWDGRMSFEITEIFGVVPDKYYDVYFAWIGFGLQPYYLLIDIQHWLLTALSAMLAATPWLHWKWRFSLRTLLIATTLIGLILGTIIATAR